MHNFPIEIKDLCEWPGSKLASLILAGNWGHASLHAVFDGIVLPHDDENKIV